MYLYVFVAVALRALKTCTMPIAFTFFCVESLEWEHCNGGGGQNAKHGQMLGSGELRVTGKQVGGRDSVCPGD